MGIQDAVRGWRQRRQTRLAQDAWAEIAPVVRSATVSRWDAFVASLPAEVAHLLVGKWDLRLPWTANDGVARPLSADELADRLGVSAPTVRERDWRLVDQARSVFRERDPALRRFTMVPIDAAAAWWDREESWTYYPDGTEKPREEWGPATGTVWFAERADQVHEIDDDEEMRLHVFRDHGRLYAVRPGPGYSLDHKRAHVLDAEDAEWDRRLRGVPLPPPPA